MKLVKHFDFTKMDRLDPDEWNIAVGDKWANNELQRYTDKPKNLFFDDGLVLRATYEDGIYESARVNTRGKFAFTYGRIDITAKLPGGQGTWPALWMLSDDFRYGHWPKSGEIDIMEHVGRRPEDVYMCLHTEKYNHKRGSEYETIQHVDGILDGFHTFSILWEPDSITYFIDDVERVRYQKGEDDRATDRAGWPFDHPFHIIMNLAVGGTLGRKPDPAVFPREFRIKEIKIHQ